MLLDYVAGKIENIPELEETQLDIYHTQESPYYQREIYLNNHTRTVTPNVL
jgi:hypothetical protein